MCGICYCEVGLKVCKECLEISQLKLVVVIVCGVGVGVGLSKISSGHEAEFQCQSQCTVLPYN